MPQGGRPYIETANVTLATADLPAHSNVPSGKFVMLAIRDTGSGMTDEVQAHMFEPFYTTKPVGEGTGLGQATCYGIVKQSGGHITVDSTVGKGTTLRIYLPRVNEHASAATGELPASATPRGTETILFSEDDSAVREMTTSQLSSLGYRVIPRKQLNNTASSNPALPFFKNPTRPPKWPAKSAICLTHERPTNYRR